MSSNPVKTGTSLPTGYAMPVQSPTTPPSQVKFPFPAVHGWEFLGPGGTRTTHRCVYPAKFRSTSFSTVVLFVLFCLAFVLLLTSRLRQADTSNQLSSFTEGGWPLDSYIFDMQWHRAPSWGGYEWDDQRYHNVTAMLASMHDLGLYTGMNLHDVARPPGSDPSYSSGVVAADNAKLWPAFAAALGVDPATQSVDFDIGNRSYAVALHDALVTPLLQQGLDMCWYNRHASLVKSLFRTFMRNTLFCQD